MKRNMKDIRSWLTDADPLRAEPGLSEADASRMRRVVVSSARGQESASPFWPRALAVGVIVAVMAAGGTFVGVRLRPPAPKVAEVGTPVPAEPEERRQLQFATPGGTRIIWTLDPNFKLGDVAP